MLENDLSPPISQPTVYLKDYQAPDFAIRELDLEFYLDEPDTRVVSTMQIERQGEHDKPLVLDGEQLELLSVLIDGKPTDFDLSKTKLSLVIPGNKAQLSIETKIQPAANTALSGLYQSSGNYCTQCEAEGFRRITYFLDRPDVLSVYTVTLHADKERYPVLLANGNLDSQGQHDDGRHWAKWHDPHPKPSYLFALVAGDLKSISDQFITQSGQQVELNIYTQAHNIDKCQHAMDSLKHAMRWDEQSYGCEYDLAVYNIVAVDDFNMGAMENKGLNIFNSKYVLASQHTATDMDFEGIESVIGHEYFHNWSGNRVTCRDWFQLSLKEGFTVFRDQQFSADMGSLAVKRIKDVQILRAYQFKEDAGPMAHPVRPDSYQEINNFYTATIYDKGAEVIRMMHRLLGDSGFRKGTDLYFSRFDGQAVTTEDFVQSMEAANQIDLQQFRRWYTQSGTPELTIERAFESACLKLTITQHCPATPGQQIDSKLPFYIPVAIALFDQQGNKLKEQVLVVDKAQNEFEFTGLDAAPLVSVLRDFSAPVKCHFNRDNQELALLVVHDDNGFARWEAMQELYLRVLLPAIKTQELEPQSYQSVLSALQALMLTPPSDKAVFAEMLKLPSNAYIAELCEQIDPLAIASQRENLKRQLARDLESQFHAVYANNNHRHGFELTGEASAERALKNTALAYLVATEQAAYHALASHQYHVASNMTDRLSAFDALLNSEYQERDVLLEDFYQNWQNETLVLDKWFSLQALSHREDVLNQVIELCDHLAFSINNPNKVRALIGAFSANFLGFHQSDGFGYQFVADKVISLNTINPQIAARLVSVFNNWRSLVEPNSVLMKTELERIAQQEDLARDVKEIVGKALAEEP